MASIGIRVLSRSNRQDVCLPPYLCVYIKKYLLLGMNSLDRLAQKAEEWIGISRM